MTRRLTSSLSWVRFLFLNVPSFQLTHLADNLMNLDLLFKSSELTGDPKYAQMAARHAETTMKSHIRPEFSTYHVVDFHPKTGEIQRRFQFQGSLLALSSSNFRN